MTIRVFASGQSNMTGRGTGGPDWASIDSRVRVWNNITPLGANGTAFVSAAAARAAGTFQSFDRNNLGVWFCHRVAQIRDDTVDMTMVSRGGTLIEEWAPGATVPMLQECIDVYTATGQPPADIFLWMQGEGDDSLTPYNTYKTAFLNLVANLRAAGVLKTDAVVIMGEVLPSGPSRQDFNTNVIHTLAAENPDIYYAVAEGLTAYDVTTHFDGPSLYTFGADRFFSAYANSQGIEMADLFALVNEGGSPGTPNTGTNKIYDLTALASLGLTKKDVTTSPDFTGTLPVDDLMTAGMLACGAVVEYGTDGTNGTYFRFESGLQICFQPRVASYLSTSVLRNTWTFGRAFIASPVVVATMSGAVNSGVGAQKRYGTFVTVNVLSETEASIDISKYNAAPDLFVSGETYGLMCFAFGFWK